MRNKILMASALAATANVVCGGLFIEPVAETTDGKTIATDGKPQVDDDTGMVSYKNAETKRTGTDQSRSGEVDGRTG